MKEGSKYQPLLEFLRDSNQDEVTLTFAEIEALINDTLPDSARSKRAWWSNRSKGALQASAWMEAGYRVEDVALDGQRV
ncbi:MAG: transcriptional regulator, partial [Cyanobacteriota bacterium]|nr:transcriptional regulator [Cyanobacteriota bacterium]